MNSIPASRFSKRCSVAIRTASFAACGLALALGCGRPAQAQAYGPLSMGSHADVAWLYEQLVSDR